MDGLRIMYGLWVEEGVLTVGVMGGGGCTDCGWRRVC